MATTIDNLRVDHHITVLQDFTDANGVTLRAGDTGIIRRLSFDPFKYDIFLDIERAAGKVALVFAAKAKSGPRNGHMREFFELGDYIALPGTERKFHDYSTRTMIVPPQNSAPKPASAAAQWPDGNNTDGPDKLEDAEKEMLGRIDHIGAAASIAEMYAQRMRAFQQAGNEPRAAAAFKLAVDWMATYAGWATSGGEGTALSYERDQFHAALVREFGYDPTDAKPQSHK